ncbi:hypothetical protein [Caldinitratiruptor microaerophilus]|uniref:Uncharacterized protein n=1 Tax=Caldinitratiruptor microaerophilus TaxID=671077 RepID=A0AA35CJQ3_9FIRM|nr:hypothetical protein [Caldinitratiruptor microaerophilus]BDG60569.1 hypothetical protein caldi_16590 [Caldinitratiruptor microaerophilus]
MTSSLVTGATNNAVSNIHHPRYSQVAQGKLRPVLNLLLQHRFTQFESFLSAIRGGLADASSSARAHLEELTQSLQALADTNNDEVTLEYLQNTIRLASESIDSIKKWANPPTDNRVELYYSFASELECTGPLVVSGPGIESTIIHATGPVDIHGYMRGGYIKCARNVSIGQIGTPAGKTTEVVVPEGYSILANKVYPNTILQVGQIKHKFQREHSMVQFSAATAETYRHG